MLKNGIVTTTAGALYFIAFLLIPLLGSRSLDDAVFVYLLLIFGFWPFTLPLTLLSLVLVVQGVRMIHAGVRGRKSSPRWAVSFAVSVAGLAAAFFIL